MTREHQRPVLQPTASFDWIIGSDEPGAAHRIAQETSWALLDRVRAGADPVVVERVVGLASGSGSGLDDIAELWAEEGTHSLAGVLWRLYLLRRVVSADAEGSAELFRRGATAAATIDPIVAGAAEPVTPVSIAELCDTILRGAFTGDVGDALDRAASYCRVMSLGAADLADTRDAHDDAHAAHLTTRALRYSSMAQELHAGARRWRDGTLA
ncbi:hypothetical protein [Leucobacter celer]|uniref:hypothetical protein n=1 Tax=Leucobacter celer TaxID=668625 RepID=UPI0006A78A1A|nr:hypothetical protein [Leucobacter celer]